MGILGQFAIFFEKHTAAYCNRTQYDASEVSVPQSILFLPQNSKKRHSIKFQKWAKTVTLVMVLLFSISSVQAATKTWVPTTGGTWTTAGNWSPSGAPATGDDVIINSNQSANITSVPTRTLASLTVSGNCSLVGSSNPSLLTITGTFSVSASTTLNLGNSTNGTRVNITLTNTCTGTIDGIVNLRSSTTNMVFTNSGNLSISSTGLIDDPGGSANSNFTLSSGATLAIGSTAGITSGTTASGNIQVSGTRSYSAGASYVYEGTANQNTGNGLPTGITGHLAINNTGGAGNNTVTLNSAESTGNLGSIDIISGIFAAGTNLTLGSTSTINRSGGSMTGTPAGTGVYDVIYTGNSMTATTELAGSGLRNVTVNLSAGQTLTLDQNRTPDGNLTITSGIFDLSTFAMNRSTAGGSLTVAGTMLLGGTTGGQTGSNFPTNFSALTLTGGTINYDTAGGGQTIYAAPSYDILTLGNTSGIQTAGGNITTATLNNDTNAANILNMGTNTLSATTINNSGTIRTQNTSASPLPSGLSYGGTVNYDATSGLQSVMQGTYNDLTLGNVSGTQSATGALTVNGTLTTTAGGTLDMGTNQLLGTLATVTNDGTIKTQCLTNPPIPTGKNWGGTVQYNALTGSQTVMTGTYNNLTLSNTSGTKTASGDLTVNGTLITTAGGTLNMVTYALGVTNVTHAGILRTQNLTATPITASKIWGGTVTFDGGSAQIIPASNFTNLTLSNSAGASLGGAVNIGGTLTLTSGILTTTVANLLAVTNSSGSAVTGYSATSYVNGPLQWSLLTGNSYKFPVGDATNYRPFELNSTVCSSPVVRVTMASTGASTVDGTLSSVAARNWFAQLIGGTFTSATVRLTESGLIGANVVASATAAQSGPYTNQGGNSIAGGTITSNAAISYTGSTYFAIGTVPAVVLSNNGTQVTAGNVVGGTTNVLLHQSALAVTIANASLTGMTCTTAGSYVSADITNLKVWYQTTSTFNAGTATLLSTLTTPGTSGAKTFPSFVSQPITSGTTGYIFITADVAAGAVPGHTINLSALTTTDFTFTKANKSGSTTAGGAQTIVPGPLDHFAISTITSPQTAGTAITGITLTAQDINNYTATGFISTVTYSGTAGITGTSAAFTAGVLSGVSVTPTVSGTSLTFVVTGSTKTGTATIATINPGAPTAISATPSSINFGDAGTVSLTASGGGGGGAILTWYAVGCGSGSSIGTASPLVISKPAVTTTYYARWENGGLYSSCLSTTVTVSNATFYSYQSGDWNTANTWTTDPSGSFWVNGGIPGATDHVTILNGRTVTINENGKSVNSLELRLGGTLDLKTTNTHNFGTITGEGVLKLASGTFPGGTYTGFVAATGGTVEYYNLNNQSLSSTQLTYNKLIVSNYTASAYTTYLNNASNNINYTVNGTFDLNNYGAGSLTFYFGNPTPSDNLINMTVAGNFTVASGCTIGVNNFATAHTLASSDVSISVVNPVHSLTLYGNFTNNGSVRFTGLPAPFNNAYYLLATTANGGTNYGDVQVIFTGATNNTVTCNGTTDFFRFIVEKGSDQTYTLDVNSSNSANFALYGPNNQGNLNFAGYGYYYKALFLHYGTLKLNSNISIPSISEGGQDFLLNPSACLWVNGANVSTTVSGLNLTDYQAATFYGKLRVSAGLFTTGDAAGIVLGDISTPEIIIEGTGTLDVSQVWNNTGATNLISYTQTSGTANFRLQGENHAGAALSLDNPNTVFNMSGGTINFTNNAFIDASTDYRLFNIQVQPGKYTISGGTININVPGSATVYTGNTTVPFYNMNITNRTVSGTMTLQMATPGSNLTVLNDLSIGNGATLDMNTNTIGLEVDRNFSIISGGTYTPGTNTTTFNGSGVQTFTNTGTITNGLNNFTLSNASNTNITNDLTIRGTLTINNGCNLNDQGFTINSAGNIINSGTHNSQANGSILLNGTLAQTIGGSGTGIFGNLGINKSSGTTTFLANQSVNGNLRLVNGILNIASYNLKFSASSAIYDALTGTAAPSTFGDTRMIKTAGDQSDGGITKSFSATGSFLYPFGSATYHPATIAISQAPTHWGDVTVKPVAVVHPSVDPAKNALKYYWKVTSSSITGILPGSISHTFHYILADVTGNDNTYITGVYRPFAWVKGDALQVDIIGKNIYFPAIQYLDGEYTAGETAAFGTVKVYYSRANGNWDTTTTWSLVSNADGTSPGTLPGSGDLVVIGDGGSNNHVVTLSANTKTVSSLQINTGSTLDVNTTTGHVFGSVTGTGKLRVSSLTATAVFPSGDFGSFLGASGGTVEYYTETAPGNIGVAFTMPTTYLVGGNPVNISTYYDLILSPATGKNITMPNTDLFIYKDLNINVSGSSVSGIVQLNNQNSLRNITINGNLNVNNGNLQFTNGGSTAQNVSVVGDVTVASGATFDVAANLAATNTLSIQGNLTNNGIFDMIAGAAQICNVTFTGAANKLISGTTATRTDFNTLTINKGTDRTSILEATVNAMTLNSSLATAMTLTNGTFRLSNSNVTLTLSTSNSFTIPSTGCLSANLGTMNVGAANNNASDLLLLGRLEILNSGTVNIGNNGGSNNDIEYAASGTPEINISGGSLNVDGQIRRNLANTLGSLIYNQSGGTVTVKGNSFDATRSMFEVLNTGSQFNVTGGNLIIVKAGSTSADFYLEPGSYTVNGSNGGHTVTIGNSSTAAAQTFKLNSVAPLWNLTVDGTTNNKTASLSINAITILNNLTINGTGSIFKANDLSVTIGGSLINNNTTSTTGTNVGGYQAGVAASSTQTTTFTGTGTITGTGSNLTNFANLVIGSLSTTPSITLGSSSNIRVNTNLTLTSGTLADAGNTITAMGDIDNSAIHSSSSSSGGILLANSAKQTITTTGGGKFGNITLNNASGADVIGDSWITGQLTLPSGLLYINDYLLVLC